MNPLPWAVLAETAVDPPFRPRFHKHLTELDGKKVSLTGFMQPLTMDVTVLGFMLIEYPIGCWFCETPEPAGIMCSWRWPAAAGPGARGRVKVEDAQAEHERPGGVPLHLTGASVRDPD